MQYLTIDLTLSLNSDMYHLLRTQKEMEVGVSCESFRSVLGFSDLIKFLDTADFVRLSN